MTSPLSCELCRQGDSGFVVADRWLRVVLVDDTNYPGYARVIWNSHVRELTDLDNDARAQLMNAVFAVETAVRAVLQPLKVNVASLGNMTPHLHWHIIPRFADDVHFPGLIWGPALRAADEGAIRERRARLPKLRDAIVAQFAR